MLTFILIVIGLVVSCAIFAMVGSRIGAKLEEKTLGSGTVEASMNSGLDASTVGGFLGIIPFLIFVGILVASVASSPRSHGAPAEGGSAASAGH